jgi:thiosulfate/3-mercaptopyruvate sulfurtransferase
LKKLRKMSIVGAICLVLGSLAVNGYAFGTSKFEKEIEKETAAIKLLREVQRGDYQVISTAELQDVLSTEKDVLVIDTMPYESSYKKGHIPTAEQFLFPIPEMTEWNNEETAGKSKEDFLQLLGDDKDRKIIIYCGFVKCTRSHNGAMWARKLGYTNVYRHPGGIFAWKGAEYTVEKVE